MGNTSPSMFAGHGELSTALSGLYISGGNFCTIFAGVGGCGQGWNIAHQDGSSHFFFYASLAAI